MSLDLSKLSPAPWETDSDQESGSYLIRSHGKVIGMPEMDDDEGRAFVDFAALARNAFDVMMRRTFWTVCHFPQGFRVGFSLHENSESEKKYLDALRSGSHPASHWADPFTALVEADKWYRENVEDKP